MLKVAGSGEMEIGKGDRAVQRLNQAAHEFEGQMLKELLKPMTESNGLTGNDGNDYLGTNDGVLGEFASEALGRALSQKGGFGIADKIVAQLAHSDTQDPAPNHTTLSGRKSS